MQIIRKVGKIAGTALTALLALVLICNLYLIAARHIGGVQQPDIFGYSTAIVISGSMSGTIEIDDMVVVRETGDYVPGDVIMFHSGESLVTHRLLEVTPEGYVTKGDANNAPDLEPVAPEAVVGEVVMVIPQGGKAILLLRSPLGLTVLVFIGFLLAELPMLMEDWAAKGKREKE